MVNVLARHDFDRLSVLLLAVVDPFLVDSHFRVFVAGACLVVSGDIFVSSSQVLGTYAPRVSGVEIHIGGIYAFGLYLNRTISDLTSVLVVFGNLYTRDRPVISVTALEGRLVAVEIELICVLRIPYQIASFDIRSEKRLAVVIIADAEIVHILQKGIVVILNREPRLVGGVIIRIQSIDGCDRITVFVDPTLGDINLGIALDIVLEVEIRSVYTRDNMIFIVHFNVDSSARRLTRNIRVIRVGLLGRIIPRGQLVLTGDARLYNPVLVKITVLVVQIDLFENTGLVALSLHMELVEGQRALHIISVLIEDSRPVRSTGFFSLQLICSARRTALTRRGYPLRADGELDLVGELVGDRSAVFELLGFRSDRLTLLCFGLGICHGIWQQSTVLFYRYVFNAVVMVAVAGVVVLVEVGEPDRHLSPIAVDDLRVSDAGDNGGVIQIMRGVLFEITPESQARRLGILTAGKRLSHVLPFYRAGEVRLAGQQHFKRAVDICLVELAAVNTCVRRLDRVVIALVDALGVPDIYLSVVGVENDIILVRRSVCGKILKALYCDGGHAGLSVCGNGEIIAELVLGNRVRNKRNLARLVV